MRPLLALALLLLAADAAVAQKPAVRVAFTGDLNLGTFTVPDGVPPDTGRGFLDSAATALRGDLVVVNYEGVLADSGANTKCGPPPEDSTAQAVAPRPRRRPRRRPSTRPNCYAFRGPVALAPRLREAGVTHANLANNHAQDFGDEGLASTLGALRAAGVRPYGPLGEISIDTIRNGTGATTVALIGFTTYPFAYNLLDIERSRAVVDSVRQLADVVLVTCHAGAEGTKAMHVPRRPEFLGREPRGNLRRWAHAVVDAGAAAVVCHGPHVLRGIEAYRGRPIAYSLGNFATYKGFNLDGPLALTGVLQFELAGNDGTFLGGRFVGMRQVPQAGPRPDAAGEALALLRKLGTADFGAQAAVIADDGSLTLPGGTNGR